MKGSMAVAYGMKKKKMAQGGMTDSEDNSGTRHDDLVDRIMTKRMSKGGMVANGGEDELEELADGRPNNFDDLALRDDLEFEDTGKSSGDLLGNEREDEDRHDMVSRIMRKRMKQHNPRPA